MSVTVRPLQPADIPHLLDLVDGLADYERLPRPDTAARRGCAPGVRAHGLEGAGLERAGHQLL